MTQESGDSAGGSLIANAINQSGIPNTIRGKVTKSVLRMLAGGPGYPYFEQIRENLDTVDGRSIVSKIVAEAVGKQLIQDPDVMERAKARFVSDLFRKHENVEAIAIKAQKIADEAPDADEKPETEALPSDDWLNSLHRAAEDASSDELRDRLAKLLAGEARKPGTYSRMTVRFIGEADREAIEDMQKLIQHRWDDFIPKTDDWNKGNWFALGRRLECLGLVSGITGTTHKTIAINPDGSLAYPSEQTVIVFEGAAGSETRVSGWLLTPLGMEVTQLLQPKATIEAAQHFANVVRKDNFTEIWLGPITMHKGNKLTANKMVILWHKPDEEAAG